ncbi:hypothetical protein CNBG_0134 [Cryptococcus deuterogattii R265]|uniref:uncharacterized protein n=1 Tax=Cryptococcus deuterogattii (strain R265) TaxID=294750 RepID=UPI0019369B7B|nr:hypothetical protein CNBG_0134 [Cryptococcus deuterogattii R265]
MSQSNAFQAHVQKFDAFAETFQMRLDTIEFKCDDSLNRKEFGIMGALGVITQEVNALRDDFLSIFSTRACSISRQRSRSHRSADLPSEAARRHSPAQFINGHRRSSMVSDCDSGYGGGIVQRALARELKRLGGAPVLAEGETTIYFNPRKRWSRRKVDILEIDEESDLQSDTASSSVYPMSTSPERRSTDDDEESEEEGENNEGGMESKDVEETERSELIPEKGEGHMHEREPFLKRDKVLAASDGHNIGGQKWPKLGLDCTEGGMKVIDCSACGGRVHWACAGLDPAVSMLNKTWCCPSCTLLKKDLEPAVARRMKEREELPRTQDRERCLRPDCIHHQPIDMTFAEAEDDNLYYMSRIVGKRYTKDRPRTLQYLVQWNEWDDYDCTWEPPSNIPAVDLPGYKSLFYKQARNENLDLSNKKTAILSQFSQYFEADGSYNVKLLKELGVADKDWWGW